MGLLNKIMFWKKDDDFNFDHLANQEMGKSDIGSDLPMQDDLGLDKKPAGLDEKSPFQDAPATTGASAFPESSETTAMPPKNPATAPSPGGLSGGNRDLELISSKLDTIKAMLISMEQRIANIEKTTGVGQKKEPRLW